MGGLLKDLTQKQEPGGERPEPRRDNPDPDAIMRVATEAGRIILESGGETYRAEDVIGALATSMGALNTESFATPTGLMVSCEDEYGKSHSLIRRIRKRQMNLDKIAKVNELARNVVSGSVDMDEADRLLCELDALGSYPSPVPALGAALITAFFCLLFGGAWNDALVAGLIGLFMGRVTRSLEYMRLSGFFINIAGGAFAAFVALAASALGAAGNVDTVIIGSIMLLVPGVMLVNAIRDTIAGDLVAGVARGAEVIISAAGISIGVGFALKIWEIAGGVL